MSKPRQRKSKSLLRLVGSRYVYRQQVPTDLRPVLERSEFKVSLGSIPHDKAKRLAAELGAEHAALFKLLRAKGALPEFLAREAEARADAQARAREAEIAFYSLPSRSRDEHELSAVRRGLASQADKEAGVWRRAQARALEAGLSDNARGRFGNAAGVIEANAKAQSRVRLLTAALAAPLGNPASDAEEVQAIGDERTLRRQLAEAQEEAAELAAIIGPAAPARSRANPAEGVKAIEALRRSHKKQREITTGKYDLYLRHFTDLFGDIGVREITYTHVDEYIDAVAGLPNANYLNPAQRQLSVEELLELRADKEIPGVGRETVVKHVDWLKALLNFAEAKRVIASNPARKAMIPETLESRRYSNKREPFSASQLREVVAKAEEVWADDPRLWYLRLCVYSGVRPDEGAQLDVFDVKKEGAISYIEVHDIDKTIKNRSSVRKVPLHPRLLELGFLEFVAGRGKGRVFGFNRTKKGEHEHATRNFRGPILKNCPSCLDANGEPDRRLVWYSIRHSFADACRSGGVSDAARWRLMGHVETGASGKYGKGFNLAKLAAEIAKADPLSDSFDVALASGV
jgi:integrase